MCRHCASRRELFDRISNGQIGDIVALRAYRIHGPAAECFVPKNPGKISDVLYQIQKFHAFLWASGGLFSDFNIHNIDECCWMKNAWPVKAQAIGGRHYRQSPEGVTYVDQNFDVYSVEYTYADGSKFYFDGRCINGCQQIYSSHLHGTKGMAIASKSGDCGQPSSIYKSQMPVPADLLWESTVNPEEKDPYVNEWNDLIDAIRDDKPYNETAHGVEASLTASMGRMAAHTGHEVTWDEMLNCEHEMAPDVDKMTADSPAPLVADANGRYPVPQPGIVTEREY
jgi:predicted dehydrogenase